MPRKFVDSNPNELDNNDRLKSLKDSFHFPLKKSTYLCGHSLGLQPKSASKFVMQELDSWKQYGVKGHMNGINPWFDYHC